MNSNFTLVLTHKVNTTCIYERISYISRRKTEKVVNMTNDFTLLNSYFQQTYIMFRSTHPHKHINEIIKDVSKTYNLTISKFYHGCWLFGIITLTISGLYNKQAALCRNDCVSHKKRRWTIYSFLIPFKVALKIEYETVRNKVMKMVKRLW